MPLYFDQAEEENKKAEELKKPNQGFSLATPSATVSSKFDGQSFGSGGEEGKGTSSGSFVPIQRYLEASKGDVKRQLADPITQDFQKGQEAFRSAQTGLETGIASGTPQQDKDLITQSIADPTAAVADPDRMSKLAEQRTAQYKGPGTSQEFEGYQPAYQRAQDIAKESGMLQTEPGRKTMIKEKFKRPTSTRGEITLDQYLMQNDPQTKQALLDSQSYMGLGEEALEGRSRADQSILAGQEGAKDIRDYFQTQVGGAVSGRMGDLRTELDEALAAKHGRESEVENLLKGGSLTPELMSELGLTEDAYQLFNVDPQRFVQRYEDPGLGGVADADERAVLAALSQIGASDNPLAGYLNEDIYNKDDLVGFDVGGFESALGKAKRDYETEMTSRDRALAKQYSPGHISMKDYLETRGQFDPGGQRAKGLSTSQDYSDYIADRDRYNQARLDYNRMMGELRKRYTPDKYLGNQKPEVGKPVDKVPGPKKGPLKFGQY